MKKYYVTFLFKIKSVSLSVHMSSLRSVISTVIIMWYKLNGQQREEQQSVHTPEHRCQKNSSLCSRQKTIIHLNCATVRRDDNENEQKTLWSFEQERFFFYTDPP